MANQDQLQLQLRLGEAVRRLRLERRRDHEGQAEPRTEPGEEERSEDERPGSQQTEQCSHRVTRDPPAGWETGDVEGRCLAHSSGCTSAPNTREGDARCG